MAERVVGPREERGWFSSGSGVVLLWFGLLAGPIAWAADLTASYASVKWACGGSYSWVLHLITIAGLVLTGAGALSAWTALGHVPAGAELDGARPFDRGRFMAVLGLLMCAIFALVIAANDIPRALLDPCL